jgi:hypothetical protein
VLVGKIVKSILLHMNCSSSILPLHSWTNMYGWKANRIIRELGMTILFHSGTLLFLWVEAFTTVVYLINRLSSSTLNSDTPYFILHGKHPIYSSLCIFCWRCFPYTWDTRQNKFDLKSVPCIFVGYSDQHKGYKWFHPTRKFLSHDILLSVNQSFHINKLITTKILIFLIMSPTYLTIDQLFLLQVLL